MAYQDSKAFHDYGTMQNSLTYGALDTVGNSMYNNFYGDPRNFMLTVRSKF